ncbi:FAD dependent oxidoreductase [Delitschia confertaspora ATCC 74209]|uniref:FAD dependent oxidoreductase n=1 Tax=Delitschia confertaspora ATCC 74209 TaxID=1513339 RepID=A0A9P4MV22_9PLEO|nr:FAD dependent oxidoreductase [Delitschia confertaspora ATCC 74209]
MHVPRDSYNIIGAGVFGASTALHLIRKYPRARIRLFDRQPFPSTLAASWDLNKVIRTDYAELRYMELAMEALKAWKSDPLFKEFYHEDGIFWISDTDLTGRIVENYKRLGVDEGYALLSIDEAKRAYKGVFEDADYTGVMEVLANKNSGWAEAEEVMEKTIQAAVDSGVEYVVADIVSLHIVDRSVCCGVRSSNGRCYGAEHTVLCTGAGTTKLLANTAPEWDELQVGNRLLAAAICTGQVKLNADDNRQLSNTPVCCQDVLPGRGGGLPPTSNQELKFWVDIPFRNTVKLDDGRMISSPKYKQQPSQAMKDELDSVKFAIYGEKGRHLTLESYRICWDAVTPDEDFIISPHPHCKELFIATAGSFHGWKFMPILGKYIVKMMESELEPELEKAWAWDREYTGEPADMWPRREMGDLV